MRPNVERQRRVPSVASWCWSVGYERIVHGEDGRLQRKVNHYIEVRLGCWFARLIGLFSSSDFFFPDHQWSGTGPMTQLVLQQRQQQTGLRFGRSMMMPCR